MPESLTGLKAASKAQAQIKLDTLADEKTFEAGLGIYSNSM